MPYGLKKLLEIEAERKRKKELKAQLKKEKEKQKKKEKSIARRKRKLRTYARRSYKKRKALLDKYREMMGDEKGTFFIYLTRAGKRIQFVNRFHYKNSAKEYFYKVLNENNNIVKFRKTYTKTKNRIQPLKVELLLVQKIYDDSSKVTLLRDNDGKFIENSIKDTDNFKIILKSDWFIEEEFQVYGFDKVQDRKNFDFIFNNLVLHEADNYTRIMLYKNKLICHYDNDLNIVICKRTKQGLELYNMIEEEVKKRKIKHVLFMGKQKGINRDWIIEEMMKKTGWTLRKCTYAP